MNVYRQLQGFSLILLTLFATSCSRVADRNTFLKENGITESSKIPLEYNAGSGWKPLAANYVYFLDVFNVNNSKQLIYILADKAENKLLAIYHVNPQVMPATYALGINPPTIVTNYHEISDEDIFKANDLTEMNALFRCMPEMKNFSWKNEIQNSIASGVILKTHFIFVSGNKPDDDLFTYKEIPQKQDHDKLLQQIFSGNYSMFFRPVKRLNETVEMGQFIKQLAFKYKTDALFSAHEEQQDPYFINDLLKNSPINFKGGGKLFLFYPFKSFERVANKGETPIYGPAVETFEYSFSPDANGFPVFKRTTHFASLLRNDISSNH